MMPSKPTKAFASLTEDELEQVGGGDEFDASGWPGKAGAFEWPPPEGGWNSSSIADFCGADANCWPKDMLASLAEGADW
jgi:hypothetical protein